MNFRSFRKAIVSVFVAIFALPAYATDLMWQHNLLKNPGAEAGSLEYWTTDDPTLVAVADQIMLSAAEVTFPNTGAWLFHMAGGVAGPVFVPASRILVQEVDVSHYSYAIDADHVLVNASVYFATEIVPIAEDNAQLTLYFIDESGELINKSTPFGPIEYKFVARLQSPNITWSQAILKGPIPKGTRAIRYELLGEKTGQSQIIGVAFDDASLRLAIATQEIEIDIKPGSDKNPVNPKSNGKLKVAIITTDEFDASTVDAETVLFGPGEAKPVWYRLDDVDYDGDLDLALKFNTQDTVVACGDTEATLTGETFDGVSFTGTDTIMTIGCKPKKHHMKKHHKKHHGGDDDDDHRKH